MDWDLAKTQPIQEQQRNMPHVAELNMRRIRTKHMLSHNGSEIFLMICIVYYLFNVFIFVPPKCEAISVSNKAKKVTKNLSFVEFIAPRSVSGFPGYRQCTYSSKELNSDSAPWAKDTPVSASTQTRWPGLPLGKFHKMKTVFFKIFKLLSKISYPIESLQYSFAL